MQSVDTTKEAAPILRYDNIVVSSRGMAEAHGKKIAVFVPAAEINRITLKFGRSDHRPMVSMTFGIILAVVGVFGLVKLILVPRVYRIELGMIVLGAIGGSIIFDTLKERYFLEINKTKDVGRLVFSKKAQLKDIRDFCRQAQTAYRYQVEEDAIIR